MDRKEMERLEKERAKLEEARARLEEERARLEVERARMEDERQSFEDERRQLEDERQEADEEREGLEEEAKEMREEEREMRKEEAEERAEELRELSREMAESHREKMERMAELVERAMDGVQEKIENGLAGNGIEKAGDEAGKAASALEIAVRNMIPSIRNVGVLNLKDITSEELDKMSEIRNSGIVIVPEELMGKVSSKIIRNMGTVVPYKKGWRIFSGSTEFDKAMLESLDGPIEFTLIGHLTIADDVTAEMVKAKIQAFHNYGQIDATEETYGALMSRCLENYGQITRDGSADDDGGDGRRHRHGKHST